MLEKNAANANSKIADLINEYPNKYLALGKAGHSKLGRQACFLSSQAFAPAIWIPTSAFPADVSRDISDADAFFALSPHF